jgi:hypothetical protein
MKKYINLDDQHIFRVGLENVNGKTVMSLVDKTSHSESYDGLDKGRFANTSIYVDKYRLLELADYIYEYCKEDR